MFLVSKYATAGIKPLLDQQLFTTHKEAIDYVEATSKKYTQCTFRIREMKVNPQKKVKL